MNKPRIKSIIIDESTGEEISSAELEMTSKNEAILYMDIAEIERKITKNSSLSIINLIN